MSKEYIERNALLDDLRQSRHELMYVYNSLKHESEKMICAAELNTFLEIMLRIKDTSAADVAEVVRCKDCKFWEKQQDSLQGWCCLNNIYPTGYWYCGNGERREKNEYSK